MYLQFTKQYVLAALKQLRGRGTAAELQNMPIQAKVSMREPQTGKILAEPVRELAGPAA
jgi:hypothetical protein